MLRVECESCQAPYQVDERRVPAAGLKMRCPKCGHGFTVLDPAKGAADLPLVAAAGPVRKPTATIAGVAPLASGSAPSAKRPAAPPIRARQASSPDLPARPGAKPDLPPRPGSSPDLPARPGSNPDLPARPGAPAKPPVPSARKVPARPAAAAAPASASADLPALASGGGLELDLPAVGGGGLELDLPALGGPGDLPAPAAGRDLPASASGRDLPVSASGRDLPVSAPGRDLPVSAKGRDLPASAPGRDLPASSSGEDAAGAFDFGDLGLDLAPQPSAVRAPSARPGPGASDGFAGFGELDLPLGGPSAPSAPPAALPGPASDVPAALSAPLELDLGVSAPPSRPEPPALRVGGGVEGTPFDLGPLAEAGPGEAALPEVESVPPRPLGAHDDGGGFAAGEAPLGALGGAPALDVARAPAPAAPGGGGMDVAHERAKTGVVAPRVAPSSKRGRGKRVALVALLVLAVVGGGALELTSVGAFGRIAISDLAHAGAYGRAADEARVAARTALAPDTYAASVAALDALEAARARTPRARALTAYAAFEVFAHERRFGPDPARHARATQWLAEIPASDAAPYAPAARALRDAPAPPALGPLGQLAQRPDAAPDAELARGETALALGDPKVAKAAFEAALASKDHELRARFGVARAATAIDGQATKLLDDLLTKAPQHPGAHLARAEAALASDEPAAAKDVAAVLDGPARALASPLELAQAYALRGTLALRADRTADAKLAFAEATKRDVVNGRALVGLAEVLYAEGRYSEALTRFDQALARDPKLESAVVGSAKAKVSLERVAEAKKQLTAARAAFPKSAGIGLWLARVELASGSTKEAERLFVATTQVVDPRAREAVDVYAGLAGFYATAGRTAEAQATVEKADKLLPDSSAKDRAFGDVAASQGRYDDAVRRFQAALARDPKDLGTRFKLGVTLRKMRRIPEAQAELEALAKADKDYPGLLLERGLLFEESGEVDKALEQFRTALAQAPDDLDLVQRVGAALVAVGKIDEAMPLVRRVHAARPQSAEANHDLGRAHLALGGSEVPVALQHLKRAVELDPNRAEFHVYLAWAANESSPAQLGYARQEAERALELDRLSGDALWVRGDVACKQGAVVDAMKDLTRALELHPTRHEARASLAACHEARNDTKAALAEWTRAVQADGTRPMWRYRLGRLLLEKNANAEAAKHLAFAANEGDKLQPRPAWLVRAQLDAGEALRRQGNKPEALRHFKRYLEMASPTDPDRKDTEKKVAALGG